MVKAGQRLYKIDPAPYIAALNSAKATLAKAQANSSRITAQAARYKVLVAANAVSKQDYDNAVAVARPGGRGRRVGQGSGGYRADQPRLYGRRLAGHAAGSAFRKSRRALMCRRARPR